MFIQLEDARIYSVSFGVKTAPAIVAIGGWIGSWELWAEPFSALSDHWYTVAYDHRGSGVTVAALETITTERMIEDVFAVMDAYDLKECVLAAESAGAQVALGVALKHPERVRGLVIVDGMYYRPPSPTPSRFELGLQHAYAATLEGFVEACVPEPDSAHIKGWGLQILKRASQAAALALYQAGGSVDLRAELHRVTQPTLILHGESDVIVPLEAAQWLAQTLPNSKLIVFPGVGHVSTMTCPDQVAQAIDEFFRGQ